MDVGSLVLVIAVALAAVVVVVLVIVRGRRARLGEIDARQVPELIKAETARYTGYARPGGPEAR
jgi:hypothetical protein